MIVADIESLSGRILGWAKRAALSENRSTLTALDVLCGVYAVSREKSDLERLRPALGLTQAQPVWAESFVILFGKASAAPETGQRMPLDETLRRAVEAAFAEDRTLPAERLLAHLLEQRSDAAVAKFLELNERVAEKPKLAPLIEFMEGVRTRAQFLEQRLAAEVLGQDAAIGMLVSAYWEACLGRRPDGPQGIFTFLGPPGVGKTLLAERFAEALQGLEGTSVMFRRFDMGSFAAPQNFEQLVGAESYYSQGRPGTLTGFVHQNPRAVILFDEIEKAHENALTALLAVLDKGELTDKNLQKTVDFRGCWFIFTTNLGREVFDSPNASGILGGSAVSRSFAFEILASARRRQEVGKEDTVPALPPESGVPARQGWCGAVRPALHVRAHATHAPDHRPRHRGHPFGDIVTHAGDQCRRAHGAARPALAAAEPGRPPGRGAHLGVGRPAPAGCVRGMPAAAARQRGCNVPRAGAMRHRRCGAPR